MAGALEEWACVRCTYLNPVRLKACEMCEFPRPLDPPPLPATKRRGSDNSASTPVGQSRSRLPKPETSSSESPLSVELLGPPKLEAPATPATAKPKAAAQKSPLSPPLKDEIGGPKKRKRGERSVLDLDSPPSTRTPSTAGKKGKKGQPGPAKRRKGAAAEESSSESESEGLPKRKERSMLDLDTPSTTRKKGPAKAQAVPAKRRRKEDTAKESSDESESETETDVSSEDDDESSEKPKRRGRPPKAKARPKPQSARTSTSSKTSKTSTPHDVVDVDKMDVDGEEDGKELFNVFKNKPQQQPPKPAPKKKQVPKKLPEPKWEKRVLVKKRAPFNFVHLMDGGVRKGNDLVQKLVGPSNMYLMDYGNSYTSDEWLWLLPLGTLIAAGHLELEYDAATQNVVLSARKKFFTELGLPLENGMPLQVLMNEIAGGENLGNTLSHKASTSWHADRLRHKAQPAGKGWSNEGDRERDIDERFVPCRHCFAPCGMHKDLGFEMNYSDDGVPESYIRKWSSLYNGYAGREWLMSGAQPHVWIRTFDVHRVLNKSKNESLKRTGKDVEVEGLSVQLREYQWEAVKWWKAREEDPDKALVPSVKIRFKEEKDEYFHWNNLTSDIDLFKPCGLHGGILASDMGMGKTVMSTAAMVSCGFHAKDVPVMERGYINGGTLVMVPAVLIKQWQRELQKLCKGISIHLYHGSTRKASSLELAKFDVVITTYQTATSNNSFEHTRQQSAWGELQYDQRRRIWRGKPYKQMDYVAERLRQMNPKWRPVNFKQGIELYKRYQEGLSAEAGRAWIQHNEIKQIQQNLSHEWYSLPRPEAMNTTSPLMRVRWNRLVCDEAHVCGSYTFLQRIVARKRWMLSGTPFGPASTNAEISRLCAPLLSALYGTKTGRHLHEMSLANLEDYVSQLVLRQEKEDKYDDGTPLLQLPPKHEHEIDVILSEEERWIYDRCLESYKEKLRPLLRTPSWFFYINLASKRLRMLASHPVNIAADTDVFNVSFTDWRDNVRGGGNRWLERGDKDVVQDQLRYVTLEGLQGILRAHGCGQQLISSIMGQDFSGLPEECSICMESMQFGTPQHPTCTSCGHMFCASCIQQQLLRAPASCPTCRNSITRQNVYAIKPTEAQEAAATKEKEQAAAAADGQQPTRAAAPVVPKASNKQKPQDDDAWAKLYQKLRSQPSAKAQRVMSRFEQVREEEPEAKFLFFCGFDPIQQALHAQLKEKRVGTRAIGGMDVNARAKALHEFETDPDVSVLLVPIAVGAVGLNLTMANHIFIVDPPNNLTLLRQAVGRCWRMGQGREVHVHKFVARGTIDDAMLQATKADDLQQSKEAGRAEVCRSASGLSHTMANDRGRGVALLAKKELLEAFGFTEDDVYDRERDGEQRR